MNNTVLSTIEIDNLVSLIANEVVKKLSTKESQPPKDQILGVKEAALFLGLEKRTIYNKVHNRLIPHQRKDGRLYFSTIELTEWIKSGKRLTTEEIKQQAEQYCKNKGGHS